MVMADQIRPLLMIVALTTISGLCDAQGVLHAARVWQDGRLIWREVLFSAVGFGFGIGLYWLVVRYMQMLGINAPEIQTLIWFGVMVVGVALISGAFFRWQVTDQMIGVAVLIGIVWLSIRTGE